MAGIGYRWMMETDVVEAWVVDEAVRGFSLHDDPGDPYWTLHYCWVLEAAIGVWNYWRTDRRPEFARLSKHFVDRLELEYRN